MNENKRSLYESDEIITVEFDEGPNEFTFELKDDKLTISSDGYDIIFKKAN